MVLIHWCRRRLLLYLQLLSVPELLSASPKSAPLKKGNLGRCRLCLSALLVASERFIQLAEPFLLLLVRSLEQKLQLLAHLLIDQTADILAQLFIVHFQGTSNNQVHDLLKLIHHLFHGDH